MRSKRLSACVLSALHPLYYSMNNTILFIDSSSRDSSNRYLQLFSTNQIKSHVGFW